MPTKRRQTGPDAAPMTQAVQATLDALELDDADAGAAQLARKYAAAIDALEPADVPRLIGTVGPGLLRTLEALGATPAARAAVKGSMPTVQSPLAKLREERAAGQARR